MIYIKNSDNSITIPRHIDSNSETFKLIVVNTLTNVSVMYEGLSDISDLSSQYVFENMDFTSLIDGEYKYYVCEGDEVIESGLLRVGDFVADHTQYQSENTFISYNG